jgi:hypothetical protein
MHLKTQRHCVDFEETLVSSRIGFHEGERLH